MLTEKPDTTMLLLQQSNLLIRAAKTVYDAVMGVDLLKQRQHIKVHGISLERDLGSKKIEQLKRKVEFSTEISLKTIPRWLINKDRFKE